jgi:hypothetical protein
VRPKQSRKASFSIDNSTSQAAMLAAAVHKLGWANLVGFSACRTKEG